MPIHSAFPNPQTVTGSVALSEPITGSVGITGPVNATLLSGSVTGLLVGGLPVSSTNPIPISGSFAAVASGIQDVTGSNWIPTITGSVVVANQVNITGSVGITAPVTVLQGTSPWIISGSNWIPTITGSVRIENQISTKNTSLSASVTFVSASALANVTLVSQNLVRLGMTIYNDTNKNVYIKLGVSASFNDYTTQLAKDDYYEVPFGYLGRIDAFSPTPVVGVVRITELV